MQSPQMLILDRLAAHDLVSARLLLTLTRESGHWAFKSAVPEYAPFAYSLAGGCRLPLCNGACARPASCNMRFAPCSLAHALSSFGCTGCRGNKVNPSLGPPPPRHAAGP